METIDRIVGISPPHPSSGLDRIIWEGTLTGSFSLKSAYGKLQERTWNLKEPICQLPLKFRGQQKVGFFPWLILKQHLLTNAERARRGVGIDNTCQVCRHGSEDVLHVLRDCLTVRDTWNKIIPVYKLSKFYSGSLIEWMTENLINRQFLYPKGNIDEIIKISYSWVKQYNSVPKSPVYRTRSIARVMCVTIMGSGFFYYNRYLGMCMVLDAELWGILDGLHLILERGYGSILIQTDNLEM
ncbi:hypothetical protein Goshw_024141, partial [Gossypium schwendimanii]|nr:hypothetical protein [Gossypium schwendimanii]